MFLGRAGEGGKIVFVEFTEMLEFHLFGEPHKHVFATPPARPKKNCSDRMLTLPRHVAAVRAIVLRSRRVGGGRGGKAGQPAGHPVARIS